jgi:hypothetical protein
VTQLGHSKSIRVVVIAFFIVAVLFWDAIPGRMQFDRLCKTQSGIRIYKTLPLDAEDQGTEFPDNFYLYDQLPIAKRYPHYIVEDRDLPGPAVIVHIENAVRDGRTGELLGTRTIFHYGGGWFENRIATAGAGGGTCGGQDGGAAALLNRIFQVQN